MSPRIIFEKELESLKDKVTEMGQRAEISYDKLVYAVEKGDREALGLLLDNDRQMTDMQRGIEAKCLRLLTKQQPVAGDLRTVSAALKVVTDIERIGDHVTDLSELFLRFEKGYSFQKKAAALLEMMEQTKEMLHMAVEAFVGEDVKQAQMAIDRDNVIDGYFNRIKDRIIEVIKTQNPDADKVVDFLMIAKYLEKIGDHAVNIGEWAIFQKTGDMRDVRLL